MESKYVARGFILNEKKELLVLKRRPDVVPPDYYYVPGGKVEEGETAEETVDRELKEELGITVESKERFSEFEVELIGKLWHGQCFLVTSYSGEPKIMEPDIHSWMGWVPLLECLELEPQVVEAFSEPIKKLL